MREGVQGVRAVRAVRGPQEEEGPQSRIPSRSSRRVALQGLPLGAVLVGCVDEMRCSCSKPWPWPCAAWRSAAGRQRAEAGMRAEETGAAEGGRLWAWNWAKGGGGLGGRAEGRAEGGGERGVIRVILHDSPPIPPEHPPRQSPPQTRAVISAAETPACGIPAAATPASVKFPAVLSQHSLRGCVVSCRPAAISRPPLNGWYKKAGHSLDHSLAHSPTHSLPLDLNLPLNLHSLSPMFTTSRAMPPLMFTAVPDRKRKRVSPSAIPHTPSLRHSRSAAL